MHRTTLRGLGWAWQKYILEKNWGRLPLEKILRSSSIVHLVGSKWSGKPKISFLGYLDQNWGRLPFEKNWGCLPFEKILRSSSIRLPFKKNIEVVFHCSSSWVKMKWQTENQLPGLPRSKLRLSSIWKKLSSSSIFKNIEVFFHISSSRVKIRLHTENQLPGLPGSALKVSVGGLVGGGVVWANPLLCQSQLWD